VAVLLAFRTLQHFSPHPTKPYGPPPGSNWFLGLSRIAPADEPGDARPGHPGVRTAASKTVNSKAASELEMRDNLTQSWRTAGLSEVTFLIRP